MNFSGKEPSFGLDKNLIEAVSQVISKTPSNGLSEKDKSKVVKKAEKAENAEHGNFKKVEKKAAKEYGSEEAGKKVAAAAMWKSLVKKKNMKEEETLQEAEQLDELSKKTLGAYVKGASDDIAHSRTMWGRHDLRSKSSLKQKDKAYHDDKAGEYVDKEDKRTKYLHKAVDKMTKEEEDLTENWKAGEWKQHGRSWNTKVFPSRDEIANKFLEKNDDHGVIGVNKDGVHIALKKDKGKKLKEAEELNEEDKSLSHEAHDLILHADNDHQLYRSSTQPIKENLKKKMKKGTYDSEKAKKLWKYHADRAAISYHKEHGDPREHWSKTFTPAHRKEAAEHWEKFHRENEFD